MLALAALPAAAELGVDWEVASNDHPFGGRQHVGLVEFKGKLYAGGGSKCGANDFFCQSGAYYGDLWVSEDGISWTKLWGEGPLFDQYDPAVAPAAQLVAFRDHLYYFGLARGALRSTDGIHWEELDVETRPGYYPVVEYQDSLQVFAGGDSAYSFDGLNWECCRFVGSPNWLPQMTVASLKGVLYVFGSVLNTPHVWRTEDLENWTELTGGNVDELEVFSTHDVRLVAFGGYLWLGGRFKTTYLGAPAEYGALWRSLNGEEWERVYTYPDYRTRKGAPYVAFGDSLYTVGGGGPAAAAYKSTGTCVEILGGPPHSADLSGCGVISLSELLRVIQFYTTQGYRCDLDTEDGYVARAAVNKAEGEPGGEGPADGEGALEGPADGESAGEGALEGEPCTRHSADYDEPAWRITLPELLRMIQLYNAGAYHPCSTDGGRPTEDGFCPGK